MSRQTKSRSRTLSDAPMWTTPSDRPRLDDVHVIVVDDGADDIRGVTGALRRCGAVVMSRSPEVTLRLLRNVTPQALVVVQSAATSDRESLIMAIRSRFPDRADTIPAIVLHEDHDPAAWAAALAAGYWECLSGPAELSELPSVVASLVGR